MPVSLHIRENGSVQRREQRAATDSEASMNRRSFLRGGLGASLGLAAGCIGGRAGDGGALDTPTAELGDAPAGDPAYTTSLDVAGTRYLGYQPTLGNAPADTTALVVAFQDPACPYCAEFHAKSLPKLRAGPIDAGNLTFVARDVAVLADWAGPAVQALAATFDRNVPSYWDLLSFVFANQDAFDAGNVLARIREFLADDTPVDAGAVVSDVEAGRYESALERDQRAAARADVSATPAFLLIRNGEYITQIRGHQPASVFEAALRL